MFNPGVVAATSVDGEPPPQQIEHTLVAGNAGGVTQGYSDNDSAPGLIGSFSPVNSDGIKIVRLLYGGLVASVTFGMEGNGRPDNNNSWRQIRATGLFLGGQSTKIFVRANANSYNPQGFQNETAWGFGPVTDGFIIGNSYDVFIDDRIG